MNADERLNRLCRLFDEFLAAAAVGTHTMTTATKLRTKLGEIYNTDPPVPEPSAFNAALEHGDNPPKHHYPQYEKFFFDAGQAHGKKLGRVEGLEEAKAIALAEGSYPSVAQIRDLINQEPDDG